MRGKKIVGYAYAGGFVDRAAYAWSAELTIYLCQEEKGRGTGRKLYKLLEKELADMGIKNKLVTERDEIIANATLVRQTLCDTTELEREKAALGQELVVLVEMMQDCIAENARIAQDQGEYQKRYNGLVERYEKAKTRFDEVTEAIAERSAKGERLGGVHQDAPGADRACGRV